MTYAQWRDSYTPFFFAHVGIILILVLRFYSVYVKFKYSPPPPQNIFTVILVCCIV
jgi:hypothetical protein